MTSMMRPPRPGRTWEAGSFAVFAERAKKRDSHSPRDHGMAVLAPGAPKKPRSALVGAPALVQSRDHDEDLAAMVKPPSAHPTSSLTADLL